MPAAGVLDALLIASDVVAARLASGIQQIKILGLPFAILAPMPVRFITIAHAPKMADFARTRQTASMTVPNIASTVRQARN